MFREYKCSSHLMVAHHCLVFSLPSAKCISLSKGQEIKREENLQLNRKHGNDI